MWECSGRSLNSNNSVVQWCELEPNPSHIVLNCTRVDCREVWERSNSIISLWSVIANDRNSILTAVVWRAGDVLVYQSNYVVEEQLVRHESIYRVQNDITTYRYS